MKTMLNSILLVDDSEADLFLTSRVIRKAAVTETLVAKHSAQEALDYLSQRVDEQYPRPAIIFLDINMPRMSGWDFLDAYEQLDPEMKAQIVVCMLTTSQAQRDREKAAQYQVIGGFTNKPLTQEKLMAIIRQHFPEHI